MSLITTARRVTALLLSPALLLSLLAILLVACGGKSGGLTVLEAQNREAASLPSLRPLSLPPRYNLDGGQASLSQPTASLSKGEQLSIGELTADERVGTDSLRLAGAKNASKDKAFLRKVLAKQKLEPEIRREIAESNKQAVPISEPLLRAIRENNRR